MTISVISNFLNVGGNAFLIWGLHMGVAGAAISTQVSSIFCAVTVFLVLRKPEQMIVIRNYLGIRPNWGLIRKVLCLRMVTAITIVKPLAWTMSFIPAYGMRAAGGAIGLR